MKLRLWLAVWTVVAGGALHVVAAPTPVYENRGDVDTPMIDATVLLNRGTMNIQSGVQPYDTQNTLYVTNFPGATIQGSGGVQFDFVGEDGLRRRAASFVNQGMIDMSDGGGFGFGLGGIIGGGGGGGGGTSWILINATNVSNRGGLTVGPGGRVKVQGNIVNLGRNGVRAGEDPLDPIQQGNAFDVFYSNDAGVSDLYWGVGQNNSLDPGAPGPFDLAVLAGNPPSSDFHEVLDANLQTNRVSLSATNVYAFTNQVSPTNWVIQAVYVMTNSTDPQFKIDVRWASPRDPSVPGAKMPIVQYTFEDVDTITAEPYTNYVYLLDNHGAMTNGVLTTNLNTQVDQRPSNFVVTRVTPMEWAQSVTSNIPYTPDLIYNSTYATQTVTNWYAAYNAQIGSGAGGFGGGGGFPGGSAAINHPTNQPGRVEIEADRLDLTLSRFRTEGLLSIKANQLVGAPPYKLDAALVTVDVGLPGGTLTVSNLVQPEVRRFNGTVSAWSGIWTNQTFTTGPDPADPTLMVTNTVDIRCHALIVQHFFITRQQVQTLNFGAHASHLILQDALTLDETFVFDAPDISLEAAVNTRGIPITPDAFPSAVNLTNGVLLVSQSEVRLGTTNRPVQMLVNLGSVSGSTIDFNAVALDNAGEISSAVGDILLTAQDLKLDVGSLFSAANINIIADDFKASGSTMSAGYEAVNPVNGATNYFLGALSLDVATRLTDDGTNAANAWTVYDGFHLVRKPAEGDLLGTTLHSKVARFAEAVHEWAAEDRGPDAAGYLNNAALGRLVLDGRPFSLFTFRAPSAGAAALYVDYLELTNSATAFDQALSIEPGFTLYFADSNVPVDQLDGAFDGRLRWVQNFAGPASGVPFTLSSGQTVRVNRALLTSGRIDSDGDGSPNALDSAPLEASALRVAVRLLPGTPPQAELSWGGTPGARYRVEYSRSLQGRVWETLTTCEQTSAVPGVMSTCDTLADTGEQRFYRVIQVP